MTEFPPFDGCVLVTRGDEVRYRASSGFADLAAGQPCSPATRFQLASVSKQFTATAILLLAEANRLRLDDHLNDWIGGGPDSWRDITIHQLLTHSSGLGHWPEYPEIDLVSPMDPAAIVPAFQAKDPIQPPGKAFHYSSPGYGLLAAIVEHAGGMAYRDFLADSIFGPAGMHDSFAGDPAGRTEVALGYDGDRPRPSFELDVVGKGAGDLWSTVDDMWRWNRAVADGLVLSQRSREQAFTPYVHMDIDGQDDDYGYGWQLGRHSGTTVRHHTGNNAGFRSYNAWLPEHDAAIIVLINHEERFNSEVIKTILDAAIAVIAE
ncbi:MAG: serine hydrolase domain-containing protein [Stackebrandtia sp.]